MSEASSSPEKTTVNIRITETFLSDVDATWEDLGYNSRSEFVRDVLRDAVKHPEFNRAEISRRLLRARSTFRKVEPTPARRSKRSTDVTMPASNERGLGLEAH